MHDNKLKVKGFGGSTSMVTAQARVKITLGVSVVYYTDIWVGEIGGDIDCLLGMDFMMAAGVRLSTLEGNVQLPDEERIPLVSTGVRPKLPARFAIRSPDPLFLPPGQSTKVPVPWGQARRTVEHGDLVLWMGRGKQWVTSLEEDPQGVPLRVEVVNISAKPVTLPAFSAVAHLVESGHIPDQGRHARIGTPKYQEWQVLIYENKPSSTFRRRQEEADAQHNARLPACVERHDYPTPGLGSDRFSIAFGVG